MLKKPKIFVYVSLTVLIIASVAFQLFVAQGDFFLSFLGYAVLFPAVIFIFFTGARMNAKVFAPITAMLFDKCDPESYVDALDKLLKTEKDKRIKFSLTLDYATGLHYLGDPRSLDMLSELLGNPLINSSPVIRLIAFNNMSEFAFCSGDYERAREYHKKMVELCVNMMKTAKSQKRAALEKLYRNRIIKFKIMADNYEGLEVDLRNAFDTPGNRTLDRVAATYNLGLYYRRVGNAREEYNCMTYVAVNGNKLFIAKKAAARVKELEAEGSI